MKIFNQLTEKDDKNIKSKFFTFDVETWGLEPQPKNFAVAVLYGFDTKIVFHSVDDVKKELKKSKYKGKYIFAHNAEYDFLTIFGNLVTELDNAAIFNGKFIAANYGKTKIVDSLNIFPVALEKIGKSLGYQKGITPKKFIDANRKKGINENDIKYCERDCHILYSGLLNIFEEVGTIKITIASLAITLFRKKFMSKNWYVDDLNNEFFSSYYGGRTEAFKIGRVHAIAADLNSLYPTVMEKMNFPNFSKLRKITNVNVDYFLSLLKSKEGLVNCDIVHKYNYFGLLPKRYKERLIFPVGSFSGSWNFNEFRNAYKTGLIIIKKINYIIYANPITTPFKDYVNFNYKKRKEANGIMEFIFKLFLNSIYGKFGEKEKFSSVYFENIPFDLIEELQENNLFYELKRFSQTRSDCYLITERKKIKETFNTIASIASYITSEARIVLLKSLQENEKAVYCDTDSIFSENNFKNMNFNNDLGGWKIEKKVCTYIGGLKNYNYKFNKKTFKAIKGVSKKSKEIGRYKFEVEKYIKSKEGLRRNLEAGTNIKQIKELTLKYNKRVVFSDNTTIPIKLINNN